MPKASPSGCPLCSPSCWRSADVLVTMARPRRTRPKRRPARSRSWQRPWTTRWRRASRDDGAAGRNVTGVSGWGIELVAKRLQLLKDLVRRCSVSGSSATRHVAAAQRRGRPKVRRVRTTAGREDRAAQCARSGRVRSSVRDTGTRTRGGLLVLADATFFVHRAARRADCEAPATLGVGRKELSVGRRGPGVVPIGFLGDLAARGGAGDKILKGANPGEIPFEQATKLELAINLKAAKVLGITMRSRCWSARRGDSVRSRTMKKLLALTIALLCALPARRRSASPVLAT